VRDVRYVCSRTFVDDGGQAHCAAPDEVPAGRWLTPAEIRADEAAEAYFVEYVAEVEAARTQ
jgi:hypothetical protein